MLRHDVATTSVAVISISLHIDEISVDLIGNCFLPPTKIGLLVNADLVFASLIDFA